MEKASLPHAPFISSTTSSASEQREEEEEEEERDVSSLWTGGRREGRKEGREWPSLPPRYREMAAIHLRTWVRYKTRIVYIVCLFVCSV